MDRHGTGQIRDPPAGLRQFSLLGREREGGARRHRKDGPHGSRAVSLDPRIMGGFEAIEEPREGRTHPRPVRAMTNNCGVDAQLNAIALEPMAGRIRLWRRRRDGRQWAT
ncbi:hypothetical protein D3C71_1745640 [compost metagenome]